MEIAEYVLSNIMENVVGAKIRLGIIYLFIIYLFVISRVLQGHSADVRYNHKTIFTVTI